MMTERHVTLSTHFIRRIKELKKKHRHIQNDIEKFATLLQQGLTPGDKLQGTGEYLAYKARVASSDMQRGKSGSFRIVYYVRTETHVLLLTIFSKDEMDNIAAAMVMYLIEKALEDLADEETDSPDTDPPSEE